MDKEELINRYFENSLTPEELSDLEQLYSSDKEFAEQFDFEKELKLSLKKEERQELKSLFSELSDENPLSTKESKTIRMRPWLMAASVALLVGISSWLVIFNNGSRNHDELYQDYFAPYENVVHPIERGQQLEDLRTQAFIAYENQDYEKALMLFKELHDKSNDTYLNFYEAISLMKLEKHKEAADLFSNYISTNGELKDRAQWYLALCYLRLNETAKSKALLKELITKGGFKAKTAKELIDELE
ncbi:MAG: hypothetical protein CML04_02630 [Pseudozobellia sp.]|nr:hypothetical protein [Pseudozobellia sp.]MBG49036.1 hypothetical protein [Pseudozobellia sp.]|tara:strand:- start:239 stop:973 length:735 start_codon:yes stop_codon:yes gene_type:complete